MSQNNMDLLAGDSDADDNEFKINKRYAKYYKVWRGKEEKQKLLDKYGDDFLSSSASESEEEITTSKELDKEWLRAYAVVRFNQPRLYSGEKLFNEEATTVTKKTEKKVTLKDHERNFVLEKGGVASDDEEEGNFSSQNGVKTYLDEQEEIKNSLKKAIGDSDDDDDKKEDSLLVKKEKTKEEEKQEENDYLAWLKGEQNDLEDTTAAEELAPLKALWSDPNLTEKERTLRDYILNNGYMNKEGSDTDDYDDEDDAILFNFDQEENFLDKAEAYEKSYNFRHEEPGGTEIKTYPRNIETSVRAKEDNRRAEKRKRKAEKKQMEKEQRNKEIKMLQRLQWEEKEEKLQKLRDLAENPDLDYNLDADFDPEEHNRIMKKHFDDTYYEDGDSEKKPVFDEDDDEYGGTFEDETDDWWESRKQAQTEMEEQMMENGEEQDEIYADDPAFVMDADYDPENVDKMKKSKKLSKKERKEKKKDKKKGKIEQLPPFDPTTKTFDEYLAEYLQDKINTLPFTYREVMPNNFGLSTDEILTAPDRELNSWVSVKKMSMYRDDHDEEYDLRKFKAKSANQYQKLKTLPSLAPPKEKAEGSSAKKGKKKKKKNLEENADNDSEKESSQNDKTAESLEQEIPNISKGKKRKRPSEEEVDETTDVGGETAESPKPKKNKINDCGDSAQEQKLNTNAPMKKGNEWKKNKKKKKEAKNKDKTVKNTEMEDATLVKISGKSVKRKKNKKKSKLMLANTEQAEHRPVTEDRQKAKKKLTQVMSASRLSSYGIGPSKKNQKKKNV